MRLTIRLCLPIVLCIAALARGAEENHWPFLVQWADRESGTEQNSVLGPIGFRSRTSSGETIGIRPVFVLKTTAEHLEGHFLYPLFNWERSPEGYRWDFFNLIRNSSASTGRERNERSLEIWPFYLGRDTGVPETSYHAVFPIAGTVKGRFGNDRIDWVLFPLYGRFEKQGVVTTTTPWPFIKHVQGAGHEGLELWPLFGSRGKKDEYKETFALWPVYHSNWKVDPDEGRTESFAVLPFYSRTRSATGSSESYLWPFFGYTIGREPGYREQRWLWPLFVQARGEGRRINRWAPFYSHSARKDSEKTWVMWPLLRHQSWMERGLDIDKTQLLQFVYWNQEQRSSTNPSSPSATKTHLWPLISHWDNGAGHSQIQILSPLEVFFQHNETVRTVYSPLLSLYRYERRPSGDVHASFLFQFMTFHREGTLRQFNLGPLLETERDSRGLRRVTLLKILRLYSRGQRDEPQP